VLSVNPRNCARLHPGGSSQRLSGESFPHALIRIASAIRRKREQVCLEDGNEFSLRDLRGLNSLADGLYVQFGPD
jgi:hypothetical protein